MATVQPSSSSAATSAPTVERANDLLASNPAEGEAMLQEILQNNPGTKNEAALREKEAALLRLGELCRDRKDPEGLASVISSSHSLLASIAKVKTAKIVRTLIDYFSAPPLSSHPASASTQISVTRENIAWARDEKRVFLRQSLEIRLGTLLFDSGAHKEALGLVGGLLKELKRLDDKMVLTEVHLLESKIRHAVGDGPKAKAALTSARTAANAIYCPPLLQAQLDMQSGVLHAEDKDYKTAYSYFFEALEGLSSQSDPRAVLGLKYMLMCKIMLNLPSDVASIQTSKLAKSYAGRDTEAMAAVAKAHEDRSLAAFETALSTYKAELSDDSIVRSHLSSLYDTLLSQNLLRIIEPYSRVDLAHIASSVSLPIRDVESKLSQMILDKVLFGILDQGTGCLEVWEEAPQEGVYGNALEVVKVVGQVVDSLYAKATKLDA